MIIWLLSTCLCALWPVTILLGCHGNIKLKKKKEIFLIDYSFKTTKAVSLLFDTNIAWVRAIQNC